MVQKQYFYPIFWKILIFLYLRSHNLYYFLLFLKTFFLIKTNVVLVFSFYKYTCSFIFIFILILCDMGTVHATYPIHFQWDEMTMKSTYIVLIVVAISVILLICYFILRLCIKSHNIDSDNE